MSARILDGRALARRIEEGLRSEVGLLKDRTGGTPHLVNIVLGDSHGACAYAHSQRRAAEAIGLRYDVLELPGTVTQSELIERIEALNEDPDVHGLMVHKPLPERMDGRAIANRVAIEKDVEGVNVTNVGRMLLGETDIIPCTPAAVMELLRTAEVRLRGADVVIVGASEIVGKPLSLLLLREYATVTVCHVATSEAGRLEGHVARAGILVVAVGKAGLIPGTWIREGTVVIDVGINRVGDRTVGDVDFDGAVARAGAITPVPGGVGPVTVMMLMRNGVTAYRRQALIEEGS